MVIPKGIVTTAWPRVVAQCADMGVSFDSWQHGIGSIALGKRKDGKYAATVGGIVLSIPRQVGKTFLVGMIVIALCILFPGMTVLWTAHRQRTATKTFTSLKGMTSRKGIKPFMLDPRTANGEQEIRFRNGSVIMFGAREQGFGRGFDEVDVEVFDEGQILTEKALEDMVAATNQSRQEAGALLFFMGTPPRPTDPGEEFTNRRTKALSGKSDNMVYVEFSADRDAAMDNPDDRAQWAKANPSFPHRTPVESMERMRENLTSEESFLREALGVWDDLTIGTVITPEQWNELKDPESKPVDPVAFGVYMNRDRSSATIAVAGRRADGQFHVGIVPAVKGQLLDTLPGTGWIPGRLKELAQEWKPCAVVIDGISQAASLIPLIEAPDLDADDNIVRPGVKVTVTTARDMTRACGNFYDAVVEQKSIHHQGAAPLARAVVAAKKRELADSWAWDRKDRSSGSDITQLVAVTLALHGLIVHGQPEEATDVWGFWE